MEVTKSVYEALQEVRYELSNMELVKTGYNAFAKFKYFELRDFVKPATRLFKEKGLCPVFSFELDQNGVEYAVLVITNGVQNIVFKVPTAEATNSNNPIQNLGSKITYLRRYLYQMALDLIENDSVDAAAPAEEKKVVTATPLQVSTIYENKDKLLDKLKELGIKTRNDIKSLTVEAASELIASLELKDDTEA